MRTGGDFLRRKDIESRQRLDLACFGLGTIKVKPAAGDSSPNILKPC